MIIPHPGPNTWIAVHENSDRWVVVTIRVVVQNTTAQIVDMLFYWPGIYIIRHEASQDTGHHSFHSDISSHLLLLLLLLIIITKVRTLWKTCPQPATNIQTSTVQHDNHQKAFRNKYHTTHGQRPQQKQGKAIGTPISSEANKKQGKIKTRESYRRPYQQRRIKSLP